MDERDSLVTEFLNSHQELFKAQTELAQLQQSTISRLKDNRELMRKVKDIRLNSNASTSTDFNRLQWYIKRVILQ
ncbi:633_t:CDS:2 [Acaulospora colombiana]|uniref:633_t:CDS:1 n=1 Tax=Acaulospora colombiana TaxID=27376 RepID=A0ACA9LKC7_9GLOM|nr:633_t:CDS:2 [Acaulospora colombiana]